MQKFLTNKTIPKSLQIKYKESNFPQGLLEKNTVVN